MGRIEKQKQAQLVFDLLMEFFMADPEIPPELLEKVDEVANYLGDIAKGRI